VDFQGDEWRKSLSLQFDKMNEFIQKSMQRKIAFKNIDCLIGKIEIIQVNKFRFFVFIKINNTNPRLTLDYEENPYH